jgi:hypothetical protein
MRLTELEMNDIDYDLLDPGIREVVRWLRDNGFETTDSGDGKSKPADERVLDYPHVFMVTTQNSMRSTVLSLASMVVNDLGIKPVPYGADGGPWIQLSFDPVTRTAIIELSHLDDSMLKPLP